MSDVWGAIGVFALGGVGWLVASFVGRPYRQFFDLRGEAIHKSMLYDNVFALEKEFPDGSIEQKEISETKKRDCSPLKMFFVISLRG